MRADLHSHTIYSDGSFTIPEIIARAIEKKIILVETDKTKLNNMAQNNQGVVAIVPPFNYCEVEDIILLFQQTSRK